MTMTNSEFFKNVGIPDREAELRDVSKSALFNRIIELEDDLILAKDERDINYKENSESLLEIDKLKKDKSDLCMDVVELQQRNEAHFQNEKRLLEENENLKVLISQLQQDGKKLTEENFENYKLLKSLEKQINNYSSDTKTMDDDNRLYQIENEQLKNQIKELKEDK
jgi:chromosome segregation ATPase